MGSEFDSFAAAFCTPVLVGAFAERDEAGELHGATLLLADGSVGFHAPEWLDRLTTQDLATGVWDTISEMVIWRVEAHRVPGGVLPLSGRERVRLPSWPESDWVVDLDRTQVGSSVHQFALRRKPLRGMAEQRRGAGD